MTLLTVKKVKKGRKLSPEYPTWQEETIVSKNSRSRAEEEGEEEEEVEDGNILCYAASLSTTPVFSSR